MIADTDRDETSRGVPGRVKGLSLVSLFNDVASEMVYPLLPAFITRTLSAGPLALGVLDGAAELTSSLVKWVSGRLTDRPGWQKPLILWGYALAVLVRPLIAGATSAVQVVGLRVVDRIGKGVRTPPRDAMIAEITVPAARGRAFGFHRAADHSGAVIGSVVAWWLLSRGTEVRSVIAWSVVPGVIAIVVLGVVLRGARADRRIGGRADSPAVESSVPRPDPPPVHPSVRFWPPVLALTALTFFRLPETLLILRLQDRGVAVAAIPLVWGGLHVVRSLSSYPGGWLSDHLGPRRVVGAGGSLFAVIAVLFGTPVTPLHAIVLFLVLGLVAGLTEAGERAVVARLAPVKVGRAFGSYHAVVGVAALPAGFVFGALYQSGGARNALWASAAGMALAVAAWLVISPPDEDR